MPLFLIGLLRGKSLRYIIIALMAFSIAVGGYVVYNKIWAAGYDEAIHEYQKQLFIETQKAVEEARKNWELSAQAAAVLLDAERKRNEVTVNVIKEIPEAIAGSDCTHLGPDVLWLFNKSIRPTGRGNASSSGSAAKGMPGTDTGE